MRLPSQAKRREQNSERERQRRVGVGASRMPRREVEWWLTDWSALRTALDELALLIFWCCRVEVNGWRRLFRRSCKRKTKPVFFFLIVVVFAL